MLSGSAGDTAKNTKLNYLNMEHTIVFISNGKNRCHVTISLSFVFGTHVSESGDEIRPILIILSLAITHDLCMVEKMYGEGDIPRRPPNI
jgi:hypothetical protein